MGRVERKIGSSREEKSRVAGCPTFGARGSCWPACIEVTWADLACHDRRSCLPTLFAFVGVVVAGVGNGVDNWCAERGRSSS